MERGYCRYCIEHFKQLRSKLIEALGGVKPYKEHLIDKFVVTPGVEKAFNAIKSFGLKRDNLYLFGNVGVGKTFLAGVAVRRAIEDGHTAMITKSSDVLRRLRGKTPRDEEQEIRRLVRMPLLVLDDLGIEKTTEFSLQMIYEIVDQRDSQDRNGLIVTSNLSLDQLAMKLGDDRLPSRLAGLCLVIEMTGADNRLSKRKKKT